MKTFLLLCFFFTALAVSIDKLKHAKIGEKKSHQKAKIAFPKLSQANLYFRIILTEQISETEKMEQAKTKTASNEDSFWSLSGDEEKRDVSNEKTDDVSNEEKVNDGNQRNFAGNLELYDRDGKNNQRIGILKLFKGVGHTVDDLIAEFILSTAKNTINWNLATISIDYPDHSTFTVFDLDHSALDHSTFTVFDLDHSKKVHGNYDIKIFVCGSAKSVEDVGTALQDYRNNVYKLYQEFDLEELKLTPEMEKSRMPAVKLGQVIKYEYGNDEKAYNFKSHYKYAPPHVQPPPYVPIGHETIRYTDWDSNFGVTAVCKDPNAFLGLLNDPKTKEFVTTNQWTVRGDRRSPELIFTWGFRPSWLSSMKAYCFTDHVIKNGILKCNKLSDKDCNCTGHEFFASLGSPGNCWWVSTSMATSVSLTFGTWIYLSIVRQAYDINEKMGVGEGEILVQGGVPSEDIYLAVLVTSTNSIECGPEKKSANENNIEEIPAKAMYETCYRIQKVSYNNAFAWPQNAEMETSIEEATFEFFKFKKQLSN